MRAYCILAFTYLGLLGVLRRKLEVPVANWVGKHLVTTSNQTLVELRLDNLALSNLICDLLGEFLAQPTCRLQV